MPDPRPSSPEDAPRAARTGTAIALADWAIGSGRPGAERLQLHATGVAFDGHGILVHGASGSGKSRLALQLMDRGAQLVSDDGIWIDTRDVPFVERPDTATDLIECRGVGLLRAGSICGRAPLALAIDLNTVEPERLPPSRYLSSGAARCPLVLGAGHPGLAEAIVHLIRYGRAEPSGGA